MAGFFDTLFGGGAEKEAAEKNRALTGAYGQEAQGYLTSGYNTGTEALNKAIGAYDPLAALGSKYSGASDILLGALGVGGPEAIAKSRAAFTNAPGYEGAIDAGLDVINRRRGVGGMYYSGNADQDAQTFGQNLQNQQYNTWLSNLANAGQTGASIMGSAAAGQAGGYGSLANLAQTYSQNQTGVAGNVLSGNVNANNLQAAGEAAGAKNLLGAGLSLASLALGGGGGGLGSSLFKGAGNLFFGGGSPSGY
ncbi:MULTISPECIES: hypothetical protein [unclassified Bradyrhizobium]|uniref:hypothetical protein n=1 Tax=unclassified Bradyrhizobium TaxID=2631580 RepID=UPI002FF3AC09